MEAAPIWDRLVREYASKAIEINSDGTAATAELVLERAAAIESGTCPPWRTDLTIPPGYEGVKFVGPGRAKLRVVGGGAG